MTDAVGSRHGVPDAKRSVGQEPQFHSTHIGQSQHDERIGEYGHLAHAAIAVAHLCGLPCLKEVNHIHTRATVEEGNNG